MEYLLSGTAFLISLAAVWFASNSTKNMTAYFNEFLETNIKTLRSDLGNTEKALKALTTRILRIEKDQSINDELKGLSEQIEALQKDVAEINDRLPKAPKRQSAQLAKVPKQE